MLKICLPESKRVISGHIKYKINGKKALDRHLIVSIFVVVVLLVLHLKSVI